MTATITDLFCGAGGSSLGAETAGAEIVMAANHWSTAIDVHQAHFPNARHDCADISQADPRRYARTDILIASPECTNHSQARGVSRRRQDPTLWDAPDPAAERSRATMWDVVRFAEQMQYEAIVVENVVEAAKWTLWNAWLAAMDALGYDRTILSRNSMHHTVPQSRDRIYIVFTRGARLARHLHLDTEPRAWCWHCERWGTARQAWKNGRTVGRYRQQWLWSCTTCHREAFTELTPAATIIDWTVDCPRIGDRTKPLAAKTRARILAGLERYGWIPITTTGAGNVHERTPGNRARSLFGEPLPTQQTTATSAIATPPGFAVQTAHEGRIHDLEHPHPTVTASDDRLSLVVPLRSNGYAADPTHNALPTVTAGGNNHGLVVRNYGNEGGHPARHVTPTGEPLRSVTAGGHGMGLLMRNQTGAAEMVTPLDEPARTMTTKGHQSLLVPNMTNNVARSTAEPAPTMTTGNRTALVDPEQAIDDCGFRMLEPYEVAAAMAFPTGYIPRDLTKRDQVKLAGNAVTPPVMTDIISRILDAMDAA